MLTCDVIGVYTSSFSEENTIEEMVKELISVLPLEDYKRVYLYGQCVGCMLAYEFASKMDNPAAGLILVAPSWRNEVDAKSPWTLLPDKIIITLLCLSGAKQKFTKDVLTRFRKDTERFFKYKIPNSSKKLSLDKVSVIFGTRDIFTLNDARILSQIRDNINGKINCDYIKGGNHFMNETKCDELCKTIRRYL